VILPLCPCCNGRHWPRYTFSFHAPTVTIAPTPKYDAQVLFDAVVRCVNDISFNVGKLRQEATTDEGLRAVIGPMSNRQLGKAIEKLSNRNFDGFVIERQGADRYGTFWHIVVVR
jgi:hypothetical protein